MADFWHIHQHDPALNDRKRTSLVLANNDKGNALPQILQTNDKICVEAPLEHEVRHNA